MVGRTIRVLLALGEYSDANAVASRKSCCPCGSEECASDHRLLVSSGFEPVSSEPGPGRVFSRSGGGVFVRSWAMQALPRLQRLFGKDFLPGNLVDLKMWRPWWALAPSLFRVGAVLTCEPYGRFGDRILQTAVGVVAATHLGGQRGHLSLNWQSN